MKILQFLVAMFFIASMSFAQNAPITFEPGEFGSPNAPASWTWTVFENGANPQPPLEFVANPDPLCGNTSATVAKFTARVTGQRWAGCETWRGSLPYNLGSFNLSASNCYIKIWVYKPVISPVGIKLVNAGGAARPEILVSNTKINEWEQLVFNFSDIAFYNVHAPYVQLVVFPDFPAVARSQTNICYFDNITFENNPTAIEPGCNFTVSGELTYDNAANSALASQTVRLMQGATEIGTTTTDGSGAYSFANVPNGSYTLEPNVTLEWKGVTAMDATLIRKHVAATQPLTGLRFTSADVNNSSTVTVADITPILQRIVTTISSFIVGDWAYSDGALTVAGADVNKDMRAICYGDVNASYSFSKNELNSIEVENSEILYFDELEEFEIPVKVASQVNSLSSLTLKIEFDPEIVEIEEVIMAQNTNSLVYRIDENHIFLAYSSLDETDYPVGDVLFYLKGYVKNLQSQTSFTDVIKGEVGDVNDEIISDIILSIPVLSPNNLTNINIITNEIKIFPNPASSYINITNAGNSTVQILDLNGKILETSKIDSNDMIFDIKNYPSGTYLIKILSSGEVFTSKFSVEK